MYVTANIISLSCLEDSLIIPLYSGRNLPLCALKKEGVCRVVSRGLSMD